MTSKKKSPTIPSTNPQTIKIGSRVRCTDDGVEGRIVWANALSVKIRWNDGELDDRFVNSPPVPGRTVSHVA